MSKQPANWPSGIIYLTHNIYSKSLTKDEVSAIKPSTKTQKPSPLVKIKKIDDKSHPAFGQCGLFAAIKIQPHQHIIDYLGYVHNENETDPNSNYDIVLDNHLQISIDAQKMGCEARMVNDYRGIQQRPNVKFDDRIVDGEQRIAIFACEKVINKGQELCINYGKGFWSKMN